MNNQNRLFTEESPDGFKEVCLEEFLREAIRLHDNEQEEKTYSFQGKEDALVQIKLQHTQSAPRPIRIKFKGIQHDIEEWLANSRGKLEAWYSYTDVRSLTKLTPEQTRFSQKYNRVHLPNLTLRLSRKPEANYQVESAITQSKGLEGYVDVPVQECSFETNEMYILMAASRVHTTNGFYVDDDPRNDLVHELGILTRPEIGVYKTQYSIQVSNDQPIPENDIIRTMGLFDCLKLNFNQESFEEVEIK